MGTYFLLKTLHIIGATVLFGTGIGIAFFMLMAHRTRNAEIIAYTAEIVVIADLLFTASAVVVQPITGTLLIHTMGYSYNAAWITASLALYVLTGALWLPVVWIQYRLRNLARQAASNGAPLPAEYFRLYRIWFALGCPAFAAVLGIYWLMVTKPATFF